MLVRCRSSVLQRPALFAASTSLLILCGVDGGYAQAADVATIPSHRVDEAVGRPGADPYMFYVFNREQAPDPDLRSSELTERPVLASSAAGKR